MSKQVRFILRLTFIFAEFAGEPSNAAQPRYRELPCMTTSFFQSIAKVDSEVLDFDISTSLFDSRTFTDLWKRSSCFENAAKKLIADPTESERRKRIASYSMQSLKPVLLMDFYTEALRLRRKNLLRQDIFIDAIFPGYDWNTTLAEKYDNAIVHRFLVSLKQSGVIPATGKGYNATYLDDLISGKAGAYVRDLRKTGQLENRSR